MSVSLVTHTAGGRFTSLSGASALSWRSVVLSDVNLKMEHGPLSTILSHGVGWVGVTASVWLPYMVFVFFRRSDISKK